MWLLVLIIGLGWTVAMFAMVALILMVRERSWHPFTGRVKPEWRKK